MSAQNPSPQPQAPRGAAPAKAPPAASAPAKAPPTNGGGTTATAAAPPASAPAPRPAAPPRMPTGPQAPVGKRRSVELIPDISWETTSGVLAQPARFLIYGPGGIGKSTLANMAPNPLHVDLEFGSGWMPAPNRITLPPAYSDWSWELLFSLLRSPKIDAYETIIVDTVTRAQELAIDWVLRNVPKSKGGVAQDIADYGWGDGYEHAFDAWMHLLVELDRINHMGKNVILVAHASTGTVPNPHGEDYIRFEPELLTTKLGKFSIRDRTFNWADFVWFVGYDVFVKEGTKTAVGSGTRTIYTSELPAHRAKSRRSLPHYPFNNSSDDTIWKEVFTS